MPVKYKVCTVESERGWGQKKEYSLFNTVEDAIEYRNHINSFNNPLETIVPDWYMYAEDTIQVIEE